MKTIMIAAPSSNSGKSLLCAGLLAAMRFKGLNAAGFKTGPDQVDRKLLELAGGKYAGNIDMYLMGEKGIFTSLGFSGAEYAIVEGVMGCFDGIGCTPENSSFCHAEKLGANIILVYAPKGEMFTMIPKLKGMTEYSGGRIRGIILNKTSPFLFESYKKMLEDNLPELKVLGFMPDSELFKTGTDYLGIDVNASSFDEKHLKKIAEQVSCNIDLESFLNLFEETAEDSSLQYKKDFKRFNLKVAAADDEAFNLCYAENLFILNKNCILKKFSPLGDTLIPTCEILYMTGGIVNKFKTRLSQNISMRKSIKDFVESGGFLLAEGEALNYLFEEYDGLKMCSVFRGKAESTAVLKNFGYNKIEFLKDNILGYKGTVINASEYHKSIAQTDLEPVFKVTKASSGKTWNCGYAYKNAIGFYQNINFISCSESVENLFEKVLINRNGK